MKYDEIDSLINPQQPLKERILQIGKFNRNHGPQNNRSLNKKLERVKSVTSRACQKVTCENQERTGSIKDVSKGT